MIPELGHVALILALSLALIQATLPIIGAHRRIASWVAVARPAALGQLLFMLISYACLTYAFLVHDFSVTYVASNSNTHLPTLYLISGVWGAHEGSLLLVGGDSLRLDRGGGVIQPQHAGNHVGPGGWRDGHDQCRLPAVHVVYLESV